MGAAKNIFFKIFQDFGKLSNRNFICKLEKFNFMNLHEDEDDFKIYDNVFIVQNTNPNFPSYRALPKLEMKFGYEKPNMLAKTVVIAQNPLNFGAANLRKKQATRKSIATRMVNMGATNVSGY